MDVSYALAWVASPPEIYLIMGTTMDIVERLRFDAARCEAGFSKGVATNIEEAAAEIERLRAALTKLRRSHLVIEDDCWYSCPKSGECCDESAPKDVCNCGADEDNAIIDAALSYEQSIGSEERK